MKIKICGMKFPENLKKIRELNPDYFGIIFYKKSPRCVDENLLESKPLNPNQKVIGVFVNESVANIIQYHKKYNFYGVQLHGNESPEDCKTLIESNLKIIKAFGIDENFDFQELEQYIPFVNYFLFDTKTKKHGGSGKTYDWNILKHYSLERPFFLSGGLGLENLEDLLQFKHEKLFAYDFNSRLEISYGTKSYTRTQKIIQKIRNAK